MDEQRFGETIAQIKAGDLASALRTIHECLDGNPHDRVAALCALGYVFERKREEQSAVYLYFQTLQLARDHKDARYRLRRLQQKFPDLEFDPDAIANSYVHECPRCRLNSQHVNPVCPYCGGTVAERSESAVQLRESVHAELVNKS